MAYKKQGMPSEEIVFRLPTTIAEGILVMNLRTKVEVYALSPSIGNTNVVGITGFICCCKDMAR